MEEKFPTKEKFIKMIDCFLDTFFMINCSTTFAGVYLCDIYIEVDVFTNFYILNPRKFFFFFGYFGYDLATGIFFSILFCSYIFIMNRVR